MAKDITGQPWIFDTAADAEGIANTGVAGVIFDGIPIWVDTIVFDNGAGATAATFVINETNSGPAISGIYEVAANTTVQHVVGHYVKGLYLQTIDAGKVLIYHGNPG